MLFYEKASQGYPHGGFNFFRGCVMSRFYPHSLLNARKLHLVHCKVRLRAANFVTHSWCRTQNAVTGTGHLLSSKKFSVALILLNASCENHFLSCRSPWDYAISSLTDNGLYIVRFFSIAVIITASFRATATLARLRAFFPPRSAIRSPNLRKSLSLPNGPMM